MQTLIESVEAESRKGPDPLAGRQHLAGRHAFAGASRRLRDRRRQVPRSFSIDIDEPFEIGGTNTHANPQEYLLAALNACMIVGYYRALRIAGYHIAKSWRSPLKATSICAASSGSIHRSRAGYRELRTRVVIKGDGTEDQFHKIHDLVMATSPNVYNVTRPSRSFRR